VIGLVDQSSELLDSEGEDDNFWGVVDGVCWDGDWEDEDPYRLDWDSLGEPSERLDVSLEATQPTPRELLNLECFINYDAKGKSTSGGKSRFSNCVPQGFWVLSCGLWV
jgi:hypothetical protein